MSERGFTLIELLIAVAIGSIVILALGGFYLSAVRFSTAGTAQADLQRQGQLVLDEIARQFRPASSVSAGPGSTCPPAATTPVLLVQRPKVATDPVGYPDPAPFCFRQSGTQFLEDLPGGGSRNLLTLLNITSLDITSFSAFPTLTGNGVYIYMRLRVRPSNQRLTGFFDTSGAEMEFKTTLSPRNN